MKFVAPFAILFVAAGLVEASQGHHVGISRLNAHHHARSNLLRDPEGDLARRDSGPSKRCKPRPSSTIAAPSSSAAPPKTSHAPAPAQSSAPPKTDNAKAQDNSKNDANTSSSNNSGNNNSGNKFSAAVPASGLIKVGSSQCGGNGASKTVSATDGPNGSIDFLNCGVDGSGWNPAHVTVNDLVTKDLSQALQDPNSPFQACQQFVSKFEQYGGEFGIPAILVASIAMQESSCNPHTVGGAGEQGLMQITKDKCGGAPGGNCQDVDYNIRTGVSFFSQTLKDNGDNVLLTIGRYNGWTLDMTVGKATAAAHTNCCRCQNNLDYLHQTLNGWCQNVNPYSTNMGKYHNLDQCN